jgi:hypothetical protein
MTGEVENNTSSSPSTGMVHTNMSSMSELFELLDKLQSSRLGRR